MLVRSLCTGGAVRLADEGMRLCPGTDAADEDMKVCAVTDAANQEIKV